MSSPLPPRAALLLIASVLGLTVLAFAPVRATTETTPGDAIVARALTYLGDNEGQCWPWVRKVVQEATGNLMGFGYHDGFIEGGATEVSLANAVPGDIIQIADPNNNGPGADYPGLHTAIVYVNHGNGIFTVIDANSQWDGIVRIRENYDPVWAANRFPNVQPRVYRFTNGAAAPAPAPSVELPDLKAGDKAKVNAPASCLNLRAQAGTTSAVVTCLPDKTELTLLSEPVAAAGLAWVRVSTADGLSGWVAAQYIDVVDEPVSPSGVGASSMPYRSVVPGITTSK